MIKVLLFAGLQEKAGKTELTINKDEMTVNELVAHIRQSDENLELTNVMIAVNEEFVNDPEQIIKTGDDIALLPPVSGG
ncbi:molybdopterin converting factor subunit 1 [Pseudalkalibacillus sp. SCS-8]|uniref:molybdopterin converting factor subunit 1 n=1 Tax=Pseudalkalibacillus nanhaiensis TaxID=3115291 RepID=UPI0032DBCE44